MIKIGMCFPQKDFIRLSEEKFIDYLTILKENGLTSFDMYPSFLLTYKPTNCLLKILKELNLKLNFHYDMELYNGDLKNSIKKCQNEISSLRKILDNNDHQYQINLVFHVPDYQENKYRHLKQMILFFKKISDYAQNIRTNILIEILSHNHPQGGKIGDDLSEIVLFLNHIDNCNFGICWDLVHTRLNQIEERDIPVISEVIKRTMYTHISGFYSKNNDNYDHIPLTNLKLQDDELDILIENNYQGVYNLEFEVENLKENISVYTDNINKLKKYIEERKNEKSNN